ncbi:hypothetical protein [Thermostaphylospora chromogena]|uniref:hypothetical protein n=1 Tax=Thermostaphylospora chromogena TaxID=35622 RepID=UPI000B8A368F|nr:hypothetical protein [Thermostaphylospora chromogena]
MTWHEGTLVLSLWRGEMCTASFRMPLEDVGRLIDTLDEGYAEAGGDQLVHSGQHAVQYAEGEEPPADPGYPGTGHYASPDGYQVEADSGYADSGYQTSPDYQSDSGYQAGSDYSADSGYADSGYQTSPDYQSDSGYQAGSDYSADSGYADSGYQTSPDYQSDSGYQAGSDYSADSGYADSGYQTSPDYQSDSGYQTGSGYRTGADYQPDYSTDYPDTDYQSGGYTGTEPAADERSAPLGRDDMLVTRGAHGDVVPQENIIGGDSLPYSDPGYPPPSDVYGSPAQGGAGRGGGPATDPYGFSAHDVPDHDSRYGGTTGADYDDHYDRGGPDPYASPHHDESRTYGGPVDPADPLGLGQRPADDYYQSDPPVSRPYVSEGTYAPGERARSERGHDDPPHRDHRGDW